jgi:hypothetical protein
LRRSERVRIAIESDQTSVRSDSLEDCCRVTAATDGSVDDHGV